MQKVIFSHIPKTAGTSFRETVAINYPRTRRLFCYPSAKDSDVKKAKSMRNLECIMSHNGFGLHERFNFPPNYITFLREPVSQVISNYNHLLNKGFNSFHLPIGVDPFEHFIISGNAQNLQAQYLTGLSLDEFKKLSEDQVVQMAIGNINKNYLFVGLMERYEESVVEIGRILNWNFVETVNLNKGKKSDGTLSVRQIDLIREKTSADEKIYQMVKGQFDEKIRKGKKRDPENISMSNPARKIFLRLRNRLLEISDSLHG